MLEKDPSLGFQMLGYTVHPTSWILAWISTLTDHTSHTTLQVFRSFWCHILVPEVSYESWGLWRFPFWNQHKIKVETVNIWILKFHGPWVRIHHHYPMMLIVIAAIPWFTVKLFSISSYAGSLPSTLLQHPSLGQKDWLRSLWSSLRNTSYIYHTLHAYDDSHIET